MSAVNLGVLPASADTGLVRSGSVRLRDDLTFDVRALTGRYVFRVSAPVEWMLKAVLWNERDITDSGIDVESGETISGIAVVLTRNSRAISGTVATSTGQPVHEYVVVAFPHDHSKWGVGTRFVKAVRADQGGTFALDGLPPAEYLLVALEYLEPGEESNRDLLERLSPVAERVTVGPGSSKSVQLTLQNAW